MADVPAPPSPAPSPPSSSPSSSLPPSSLELIFYFAGLSDIKLWLSHPDYPTLKACSLVSSKWRKPAQKTLYRHIRISTPASMLAIRSRESRRLIEEYETEYLDSENQWGIDSYWLLDRVGSKGSLKGFSITYDPLRGATEGQADRDEEWLEWDILRHPALTGVKDLCCKADFKDPSDTSPITLPLAQLTFGKLPLANGTALHKALLTSMNTTLRTISLDFAPDPVSKPALDDLIEYFQTTATTLEYLHFLNKPNLNFLMSLHSKMNATKMPNFYSVTYPLLPKALAPFNVLCLACINNGTSLVEFKLVEPPYYQPSEILDDEDHEALVLRYLAAFGSRLDSFNIMGRRFRFMFPRQWSARFTKIPEVAKFIDRASARGCETWCGAEQRFSAAAKAVEKRKGKRVAKGGGNVEEEEVLSVSSQWANAKGKSRAGDISALPALSSGPEPSTNRVEQAVLDTAAAASASATKKKKKLASKGKKVDGGAEGTGVGKAKGKSKGKAVLGPNEGSSGQLRASIEQFDVAGSSGSHRKMTVGGSGSELEDSQKGKGKARA